MNDRKQRAEAQHEAIGRADDGGHLHGASPVATVESRVTPEQIAPSTRRCWQRYDRDVL